MISKLRDGVGRLFTPLARWLLRHGVSPDAVTIVGTLGVVVAALWLFPLGYLFAGTMVCWFFAMSDAIDGLMARLSGRVGPWGAFLDSTLDRIADGAIFTGLVLYLAGRGEDPLGAGLGLACLVLGSIVPYARARAEGLGMTANVGIAERGDRLTAALTAAGLVGVGLPPVVLTIVLGLLAVASAVTVVQRMVVVRRQAVRAAES
ncbi:MAG: CDP-alcohol phosphatidyltransferase family protein [Actinomycetales bacterium]|nr:CDP-alcohol phosphatidyltransferase family protein [Actinomycetales bacterium]